MYGKTMPIFPTYRRTLPRCLSILKPGHYMLLTYWVYFNPTALKCYFYQTLPELYNLEKPINFFRKWGTPAFRNLFIMIPIICLLLTAFLGVTVTALSAWKLNVPVDWAQWVDGGILGVALGITIGMAFGMVGRVMGGIALSSIVGIMCGVTTGILGGVSLSVATGVSFTNIIDGAIVIGTIFGILGGLAFTIEIEIGIALSLAFAVMAAVSFGVEFIVFQVSGIRFGALQARGMLSGAFVLGAFRIIFYPIQWVLALCSVFYKRIHPIFWDELTIIPLPFTRWQLTRTLRHDEQQGLQLLTEVGRNLFRRATLQTVLYRYLHKHDNPLRFLYSLLANPTMEEYLCIPIKAQHWEQHINVRRVFLGELALRPVETTQYPRFHRSSWWLNLRKRRQTPLTKFAGMLYDLSDEAKIERGGVDLTAYEEIYTNLSEYPDGEEIIYSYNAMATFGSYKHLFDLPEASVISSDLALRNFFQNAIRPAVLIALTRLGKVGIHIASFRKASTQQTQLADLAGATRDLNELNKHVAREVMTPEKFLLQRIIHQWQKLILEAIGTLGKSENIPDSQLEFTFGTHDDSATTNLLPSSPEEG